MASQVLRSEPMAQQAYRLIRQAILQRRFGPGQRLIETELAVMLGVSRTPVREALSKLEVDGLVDLQPTGGVIVRDIEKELARLDEVCARALAAVDTGELEGRVELNNAFHRLLTEASRSPRLIRLTNSYREYFLNAAFLQHYDRDTSLRHHRQHRAILDAVRQGRGDRAERLVAEHFRSALAVLRAASGAADATAPKNKTPA